MAIQTTTAGREGDTRDKIVVLVSNMMDDEKRMQDSDYDCQ
jgi:hypothetical protein